MNTPSAEGTPNPDNVALSSSAMKALLTDIFAQEMQGLDEALDSTDAFDPIAIRDLIRHETSRGKHPAKLVLGQNQTEAYRNFLWVEYGEEPPENLRDHYFLGLQVVQEDTPDKIALTGEKEHDAWDTQLPPLWQDDSPTDTHQAA